MTLADASFLRLGEVAGIGSLVLVLIGCVLLHVRLRKPASLSLLVALAAITLWFAVGRSMVYEFLVPPYVPSPSTEGVGNHAQAAFDAMSDAAPAGNAMIAGDAVLLLWTALSFVFAVASISSRANNPTKLDDRPPR